MDMKLQTSDLENGRNFANKLWNTARFVIGKVADPESSPPAGTELEDRWIRTRLARLTEQVNRLAGDFQLGAAAQAIYDFIWHEYADWYIEMAKVRLARGDRSPERVLIEVLLESLRLLHPYMPFVTEEIWQNLEPYRRAGHETALIVAPYPRFDPDTVDAEAERLTSSLIELVRAARNLRAERRLPAGQFIEAVLFAREDRVREAFTARAELIESQARLRPLQVVAGAVELPRENVATAVLADATVAIRGAAPDTAAERGRIEREIADAAAYVERMEGQLAKARGRAPEKVVAEMEEKLAAARIRLDGLRRGLDELAA
jgi:valyl-tRNA synthetase